MVRRRTGAGKGSLSRREFLRVVAGGLGLVACGLLPRGGRSKVEPGGQKGEVRLQVDRVGVTASSICFQDRLVNPSDDPETSGSWEPEDPNQQFLLVLLMVDSKADLELLKEWPRPGEADALAVTDQKGSRSEWRVGIPMEEGTSGFEEEVGRPGVFFVFLVNRTVTELTLHFPDGVNLNLSTVPNNECWFEG